MSVKEVSVDRSEFQQKHGMIGQSLEIQEIVDVIQQVAPTDITVLITGESGVGKEVIAKAIHNSGRRAQKPLVTVNCGAIPEGIIESELFGHEKGAFTGATETRKGYFELADGGTIFLDEIGELPLGTQVKFLRALENGEFMRVGGSTLRKVNVRFIAATNKDLEREVRAGNFRPDLFFRLRSVNIRVPPLRERREDIRLFFNHFVKEIADRNGIAFGGATDEAMEVLKNYDWPGNVRELRNLIESMLVIEAGKMIDADDVRRYLREYHRIDGERGLPVFVQKTPEQAERELIYRALLDMKSDIVDIKNFLTQRGVQVPSTMAYDTEYSVASVDTDHGEESLSLDEMERRLITEALERYRGNRRLAAKALNISERTLYRKIKQYGLPNK
ncbi:MAG: sigma-54 interaction domain-containing protein [Bacteroidota bacterium]